VRSLSDIIIYEQFFLISFSYNKRKNTKKILLIIFYLSKQYNFTKKKETYEETYIYYIIYSMYLNIFLNEIKFF